MKLTRRTVLLFVWAISIVAAGILVANGSGVNLYGWATGFSLLAISLGVPLMRALTEFSK